MKGLLLFLSFTFYGFNAITEDPVVSFDQDPTDPCLLLTEDYVSKSFAGATNVEQSSRDTPYASCIYRFDVNGKHYYIGLTIVEEYGSAKNLDRATLSFDDREPIDNVGQKAYYTQSLGQISVWQGKRLLHVFVQIDESGDKDKAIEIMKYILGKL